MFAIKFCNAIIDRKLLLILCLQPHVPPLEVDGAQWGEAVAVERQMGKFGEKWAAVGPCSLHAQSAKKTTPGKTLL